MTTIVGREFAQNNDLLIIEDPTRGIDVGAIEFIWQKIIDIAGAAGGTAEAEYCLDQFTLA